MGKELVSSYMRNKLSSILEEAEAEVEAHSGSSSDILSRIKSLKDGSPVIPVDGLQELIESVSEWRVFSYAGAVSKRGWWLDFRNLLLHPLSKFMFNRRMRNRLDSIGKMLIRNPPPAAPPARRAVEQTTRPIQDLPHIIGFEAEADKIEAWLVRGEDDEAAWRAVGIVGRCGCGKTALAQKVFASPTMEKEFSPRIWVCLSSVQFSAADPWARVASLILREIASDQQINEYSSSSSLLQLKERLDRGLKWKRYLIVLDDAWPLDQGGELFLPRESGGAVIVTTRLKKAIGELVGDDPDQVIRVEPQLSHEICWQIFSQVFQRHGNFDADRIRPAIHGDIKRNIDRLPLAANTLGKILPDLLLKSYWIRARDIIIFWGSDTRYWRWTFLPPPQEGEEIAELLNVCWLEIKAEVNMNKFLILTKYSAYLVFKLEDRANLDKGTGRLQIFHNGNLKTEEKIRIKIKYWPQKRGGEEEEEEEVVHFPQARVGEEGEQGWMEVKVGEFTTTSEDDGRSIYTGLEVVTSNWKFGLVVKGIEIRPNYPLEF